MAELTFNALVFDSQCTPDPLPQLPDDGFPADCGLTADQKSDLGLFSDFVGLMDTPAKVVEHWGLLNAKRAAEAQQRKAEAGKDPVERARVQALRTTHAGVVNAANVAWREAVAERARVLAHHNEIVKQKHAEFKRLKEMKVEA